MGQTWAKNTLFYPKEYPDEGMKYIPFPRLELYDHVATKATQVTTVIGLASGGIVSLVRRRELAPTAFKFGRRGFVVGLALTPLLVEGTLKSSKSGPEQIYDRCYRIRYNRSQVRSAQWSTYIPAATAAAGAYIATPPTTRLLGAVNGFLLGYAGATLASAAIPIDKGRKAPKKEKTEPEATGTN